MASLLFEVDVSSQNQVVGDLMRQLIDKGALLKLAMEAEDWPQVPNMVPEVRDLVPKLRNACRWDLGLFADPPDTEPDDPDSPDPSREPE